MSEESRILMLEDVQTDVELTERELRKAGLAFTSTRVDTKEAFVRALGDFHPTLILADYKLPTFDGLSALLIAREQCPDVPFLFVTGTLGEETAIEMLKQGATDYILKDRLFRLGPAVLRAINEAAERQKRKRADEALHKSAGEIADLYNNAPCGYHSLDKDGVFVRMNDTELSWLGYAREEIIGKVKFPELLTPESLQIFKESFPRFKERGFVYDLEFELVRKDSTILPVLLSATAIKDSAGNYVSSRSTIYDITERRRAEEAMHESEEKFRLISTSAQDAIVTIDPNGEIAYWNPAAEKMFGYSTEEALGSCLHRLIAPPRYHEDFLKGFEFFRSTGKGAVIGKTFEITALRKGGEEFSIELSISAIRLKGQWNALGIIRDITARKHAEEALKHSESSLKEAQRIAHLGNWDLDLSRNALSWSDEIYRIFEIDPNEFGASYEAFLDAIHPDDRETVNKAYTESLKNKTPYAIEHRLLMKDGRLKYVNEQCETFYGADDQPLRSIGTMHDITERKLADLALQKVNRALTTLSNCNTVLIHAENEQHLLNDICRVVVEPAGYRMAWVGFAEHDEEKTVRPVAQYGYETGYLESAKITWSDTARGQGPTGTAIRTGVVQITQNLLTDPRMAPWRDEALKRGYASSIALPLRNGGGTFGTLTLYAPEPDAFSADEVGLLCELAADLSYGITAMRVRTEREEVQAKLSRSIEGTIQAVASTVEMRDPYTAGHQRRVAGLAAAIAAELGLNEELIHSIRLAGIVHDLGKISIPAEILSRPGRLSEVEYQLIQSHPQAGYDILKDIEFPWPIAQIVLQHHERLDGSGYPQGLKGTEILPETLILSVADVVEAMTSHRPYRPGLGLAAALDEIRQHQGVLYDPAAVDACLRLFEQKGYVMAP